MRRTKALIAMVLTGSLFLIIFYSTLNLQVSRREISELTKATSTISTTSTTPKLSRKSITAEPSKQESIPHSNVQDVGQVSISASFRKAIPRNSAFWNRKFHSSLRQLDLKGNLTAHELFNGSHCTAESVELLRTNIQDFNSYPELYQDFLRGMDCRNPKILIDQPNKCASDDGHNHTFLLFAIKSVAKHFERRQAVRDTWGREALYKGGLHVRTVFLLGQSSVDDPNLEHLLSFEAQHFGDLLVWDFRDSFYNLTLKEHVFFRWACQRCLHASFIFKGDDDVFVNTPAILRHLQSLDPMKFTKLYTGQIISDASPLRDAKIKYYVPHTFYEGPYPAYAGGGGFLFSGSLLKPLDQVSQYIPFFPIDDVYTGMCFQALGISPEKHTGFQTFDIREQDRENACVHRDLLLVHRRNPQQTMRLWRSIHSPLLTC